MAVSRMTLTRFLRESGPVLEELQRADVRLQRRDGDDVYLKRADREEAERESLATAGRLLLHVLPPEEAELARVVEHVLPWTGFLPEADRARFVTDFVRTIRACEDLEDFAPVGILLRQWKNTAEVWANPALRSVLTAGPDTGAVVVRPAVAG